MRLETIVEPVISIFAVAVLLTPLLGVAVLRGWRWDWQCWWVLGLLAIGLPLAVVSHSFFSFVLLGTVSVLLERQRRGLPAPALWPARLVRALAGAGLF